jgi:hypothetical protein
MSAEQRSLKTLVKRSLMIFGVAICAPVIVALAPTGYALWRFSRLPVSASKLSQLKPGMDTARVEKILGKPTHRGVFTNQFIGNWTQWTYSNPGNWKFVCVYFDGKGVFENYIED